MLHVTSNPNVKSIVAKLSGKNGKCFCPAHDDSTPSLSVREGRNGQPIIYCHAGCSQEAVIAKLRDMDLWPPRERVRIKDAGPKETEQTNEHDERHHNAMKILRLARQDRCELSVEGYFEARSLDKVPTSALMLSAKQTRDLDDILAHPGYPAIVFPITRADEVVGAHVTYLNKTGTKKLAAKSGSRQMFGHVKGGCVLLGSPDPKRPLIVAEGVETAMSASALAGGLPAIAALTANNLPFVQPPECSEIIVAADNDVSGTGQSKATEAAQKWANQGRNVRLAVPDRPKGHSSFDWNDALREHDDTNRLRGSLLSADIVKRTRSVRAVSMKRFLQIEFPPRPYLMSPWLTTSGLAMIHAQRGAAKTWLALSVAYAVATGVSLMGWKVDESVKVLYVDGELAGPLLQRRLTALGHPTSRLRILTPDLFRDQGITMPNLGDPTGRDFLDAIIEEHGSELIVLDSISTLVRSGEENAAEPWFPIQEWALQHRSAGRTILFVHHEGRSGKPRGTSKREDVLDTMIGLKVRDDLAKDNESAFELRFTKSREFFGDDAASRIVRLSVGANKMSWSHESPDQNTRERIEELMDQGFKQKDIAKELNITPGRVSQVVKDVAKERAKKPDS